MRSKKMTVKEEPYGFDGTDLETSVAIEGTFKFEWPSGASNDRGVKGRRISSTSSSFYTLTGINSDSNSLLYSAQVWRGREDQ